MQSNLLHLKKVHWIKKTTKVSGRETYAYKVNILQDTERDSQKERERGRGKGREAFVKLAVRMIRTEEKNNCWRRIYTHAQRQTLSVRMLYRTASVHSVPF